MKKARRDFFLAVNESLGNQKIKGGSKKKRQESHLEEDRLCGHSVTKQ